MNLPSDFINMQNLQNINDPNYLLTQQYLLQFCLANGYQLNNNYPMPMGQMMNQNMPQQMPFQNTGNNLNGNDNNLNNMQIPGQDINFLNNFAMLQMMNNGEFGNMNAMMGTGENNNQDSQ